MCGSHLIGGSDLESGHTKAPSVSQAFLPVEFETPFSSYRIIHIYNVTY